MKELVRDTYRYRELIWALALKELTVRDKRSVPGYLWSLSNPALMMLVITFVSSTIFQLAIKHYAIFCRYSAICRTGVCALTLS